MTMTPDNEYRTCWKCGQTRPEYGGEVDEETGYWYCSDCADTPVRAITTESAHDTSLEKWLGQ